MTVIFAFYNGFLGIYHRSLWHGSICVYYIVLVLLRVFIITARKRIGLKANPGNARDIAYVVSAVFLFFAEYKPCCSGVPDGCPPETG